MPGTFVGKALGDGTLPTTKAAIYTVPVSTVAFVKSLSLFNENAASQTIILHLNTSGTSRRWRRFVLAQNESADAIEPGGQVVLEAGDLIEAETTTSTAVPYTITGVEET